MNNKSESSRITIDIPKTMHRKLKSQAALLGKSMRDIILEAISNTEECLMSNHQPNKKTIKAIQDATNKKNRASEVESLALSKKLGL
ncbi:MAG: hypothetical protein WCE21_03655 [Candidatus Babeliales bacterium]